MIIDPLEIPRLALADFGADVVVTPLSGAEPFTVCALFSARPVPRSLGQSRGEILGPVFRVDPDRSDDFAEGDLLTHGGDIYAVVEIVPVTGNLTSIRVVPR